MTENAFNCQKQKFILYQIIKNITLMHMNGNKCFKFHSVKLGKMLRGLANEHVKNLHKSPIGYLHDFSVLFSIL